MPRATGVATQLARYEEAWEAINRLIRRGGSWSGPERNCWFVQGPGGIFENASAVSGLDVPEDGRGLVVWDFDRDGDPDLLLKSRNAPQLRLWRNDVTTTSSRLQVELRGSGRNRQAVGARVTLAIGSTRRVKEVSAGGGFLSQSSPVLHFGLGSATRVDRLDVRWPSGRSQSFSNLAGNRRWVINEGDPAPGAVAFASSAGRPVSAAASPASTASATTAFWLLDPCPLPELDLRKIDGTPLSLESYRNRALVLAFWSPECPRCAQELEGWTQERAKENPLSLPVLAVTLGADERRQEIAAAASRFNVDLAVASEAGGLAAGVLLEELGHWPREIPVPSTLLVNADLNVVKMYRGMVSWQQLVADAAAIPASPAQRLGAALPFAGKYYSTELYRNDFQLGVSYLEAGLESQALIAFERSLKRRPDQPDALYNTGVIHQRRGEVEKALSRYEAAVRRQPEFADAHANIGVLLAQGGHLEEAERAFRRVLELRGDHAEALINLGNVELARGKPAEALERLSRASALEPEIPQIQKKMGDAYRRIGDTEQALKAYTQAVRLAPRDAEAWSNLGVLQAETGRLDEALKTCLHAIEVDPNYASAHNNVGLVLQGLGRPAEAVARFERAVALGPRLPTPYLNLARAHWRAGDNEKARVVLERLLELEPGHPGALELMTRLQRQRP